MIQEIITELQSLGARVPETIHQRRGGAGPAEAGYLLINDVPVSVPMGSPYVSNSPYFVKQGNGEPLLLKDGKELFPVGFISRPRFYDYFSSDGLPFSKIALLHGRDCLATSVIQTCLYWHSEKRCRFCGIELSLENGQTIRRKTPAQLAEVARLAESLDHVRHVVLTTGTDKPPGREISLLSECASAIKKTTGLPVHAQCLPPADLARLTELKDAGVDTLGMHIESFDLEALSRIAPIKAAIGLKRYRESWKAAVDVFGPNQVSSFLLVGLGEKPDTVIEGSETLADSGVYPFVVPLRPIPGSLMADMLPPEPKLMKYVYEKVAGILKKKGLSATQCKAGCVRCGACSALPAFEMPVDPLTCHVARTRAELNEAFVIRKEVFVLEQKIFNSTDRDEYDSQSIHLVVETGGQVVGTVRIFPTEDSDDHWIGGRLAVKKGYRRSGAGELLVLEAMKRVKRYGCNKFTAHIQVENVPFFSRLGWKAIAPVQEHCGRPHQLMEADLDSVQTQDRPPLEKSDFPS